MILIIAEKPSLARNIVAGIGNMNKRDGYFEGCGYLVSWAFGHLFSLCDIEEYTPGTRRGDGKVKWTMDNLPCFPETFRFELRKDSKTKDGKPDNGVKRQFGILKSLCGRPDVDTIVNAGDADREGEIIVRLCVTNALPGGQKKFLRLWLPDQTPETVRKALAEMKDEREYDNLANEGFARTYIDWLYGVNLTRYATLRTGKLLRVGRVIVPIVRAIYDRDLAIRNFVPGKYLALISSEQTKGETVELQSKNKFEPEQLARAQDLCRKYNEAGAVVTAVKRKKENLSPGKLYSLSKLQSLLGKKYKMSMKDSLDVIQGLYEKGFLTYPRTNSEYLATAEKDKIRAILANVARLGYPVAMREDKGVFDDAKIESHSALTPTYKIPAQKDLSEREKQVYSTVFRRFVAVFCSEKCVVSRTEITVTVAEGKEYQEDFLLKGTVMLEPGWTKYDDRPQKDKLLPELKKGEAVVIDFKPTEKETTPPKHYTIETLNNYLKNPFREEKAAAKEAAEAEGPAQPDDDAEDYRAVFEGLELGTEATRTGIIDNARNSGYIELKKDVYTILPGGEFLIESLDEMQISMDKYKTSELGVALKKVFHGKMTVDESVGLAEAKIAEIFARHAGNVAPEEDRDTGLAHEVVGTCPLCGKDVSKVGRIYGCTGYKDGCKFKVGVSICKRPISVSNMKLLLTEGKTSLIRGFISPKSGKSFDAFLRLEDGRAVFEFPENRRSSRQAPPADDASAPRAPEATRPAAPVCPRCGKPVVKGKTAYGCLGFREGCNFRIPLEVGPYPLSIGDVAALLGGGVLLPNGAEPLHRLTLGPDFVPELTPLAKNEEKS